MARPIHFLAITAPSDCTVCGIEGSTVDRASLTVRLQRVTCWDCLDRLNRHLAMLRNRAQLGFQSGDDGAAGSHRPDSG